MEIIVIIITMRRKDNEEIVEECGRMDEELQRLKVNLKEADEVMSAMEEKRDSK